MSELIISHSFVRKLATNIRAEYGKDIKHTQAINLIAKSLGWNGDALMHRLKNQNNNIACNKEPYEVRGEKITEINITNDGMDKRNVEVIKECFKAILSGDIKSASIYTSILPSHDAWCSLLLAFFYRIKVNRGDKSPSDGPYVAEKYLVEAFKRDIDTVKFVSQIVGVKFYPRSLVSEIINIACQRPLEDAKSLNGKFVRSDLMGWATFIAQKWGFLIINEQGEHFDSSACYQKRYFHLERRHDVSKFLRDIHFWEYIYEELDDYELIKDFNDLRYTVLDVIDMPVNHDMNLNEAISLFKPYRLIEIANKLYEPAGGNSYVAEQHNKTIRKILVKYGCEMSYNKELKISDTETFNKLGVFYRSIFNKVALLKINQFY